MAERELNPDLRSKPMEKSSRHEEERRVGDAGLDWHRRAYERCKQQAKEEQRPLGDVVAERYGVKSTTMKFRFEREKTFVRCFSRWTNYYR